MDTNRFDAWTKTLTGRLSRRNALKGSGLSLGAAALGAAGLRRATAQDATPVATPDPLGDGDRTYFLFVQTFASGTLQAHPTEAEAYTLTLTGGPAQTVYFSDRPERIVGTLPTTQFLDGLGFSPANPPNAALVAQTDAGEDIVVVELLNPVYTEGFGPDGAVTLTYDVRILDDYAGDGLAHLAARQDDAALPESFGAASLFIDDCADADPLQCWPKRWGQFGPVGDLGRRGMCWKWSGWETGCTPCAGGWEEADWECNRQFPDACNGDCLSQPPPGYGNGVL